MRADDEHVQHDAGEGQAGHAVEGDADERVVAVARGWGHQHQRLRARVVNIYWGILGWGLVWREPCQAHGRMRKTVFGSH